MKKKISKKDKIDWSNFINSNEKIIDKESQREDRVNKSKEKIIDLHGFSLVSANELIEKFILKCFEEKVTKIVVITGKGTRSKNVDNPYQSRDLSILKNSVPYYIQSKDSLMKIIKKINIDQVSDIFQGSFEIFLKKNNKIFNEKNLWEIFYYKGKDDLIDMLKFEIFKSKKTNNKLIKLLDFFQVQNKPIFPINGKDLILKYNLKEGRELGEKLKKIENIWIQNGFKISSKDIDRLIKN